MNLNNKNSRITERSFFLKSEQKSQMCSYRQK